MSPGKNTRRYARRQAKIRNKQILRSQQPSFKATRKARKALRTGAAVIAELREGLQYESNYLMANPDAPVEEIIPSLPTYPTKTPIVINQEAGRIDYVILDLETTEKSSKILQIKLYMLFQCTEGQFFFGCLRSPLRSDIFCESVSESTTLHHVPVGGNILSLPKGRGHRSKVTGRK